MQRLSLCSLLVLVGLSCIYTTNGDDCNYFVQGDLFAAALGFLPGTYAEGYCNLLVDTTTYASFDFTCDSSGDYGTLNVYESYDCTGNANETLLGGSAISCGNGDDCDIYGVAFADYNDTECEIGTVLSITAQLSDNCFLLTFFGLNVSYASVVLDEDSWDLIYYDDNQCTNQVNMTSADTGDCVEDGDSSYTLIIVEGDTTTGGIFPFATTTSTPEMDGNDTMMTTDGNSTSKSGNDDDAANTLFIYNSVLISFIILFIISVFA